MRILLIDLSGIFRAQWHASADQELGASSQKTIARIEALRELGCDHMIACCDAGPYTRRLALLPTYKGQRERPSETMLDQFRRVKERLAADGLLLWYHKGEEADDVIASVVAVARTHSVGVTIASSDKDLLQLVSDADDVDVYNPATGARFREADVLAYPKLCVPPKLVLDSLTLQGDTSDNVPGVAGVGPKRAAALLAQFGTWEAVFQRADEIKAHAVMAAVGAAGAWEAAKTAHAVITLRSDLPIAWDDIFKPREVKPIAKETPVMSEPDDAEFDPISPPQVPPQVPHPAEATSAPQAAASEPTPSLGGTAKPAMSTAIVRAPVPFELQLEPRGIETAQALSVAIHNSRMYAEKYGTSEAILVVMMRGRSLGLSSAQALEVLHYFQGKASLPAQLIAEMCERSPHCEYTRFIGGDDTYAEWETKHRKHPEPERYRYTIEMAKQVGLCPDVIRTRPPEGKDTRTAWEKRPAQLLSKTARAILERRVYPGEALGLYSLEELGQEEA